MPLIRTNRRPIVAAITFSLLLHIALFLLSRAVIKTPLYPPVITTPVMMVDLVPWEKETPKKRVKKHPKPKEKKSLPKLKGTISIPEKKVKKKKTSKKREDPERRRLAAIRRIEQKVARARLRERYFQMIQQRVKDEWAVPDALLTEEGLRAIIRVKIDKNGRILETKVEKSSGNPYFDRSALQAIARAEPLPPPPKGTAPVEIGLVFQP